MNPHIYDEIETALNAANAVVSAPECHGILCGLICAQDRASEDIWKKLILPVSGNQNQQAANVYQLLQIVYTNTAQELCDHGFTLTLLLPNDDQPLAERVKALSLWCQGFLLGMTEGGLQTFKTLPTDTTELMHDFVKIARLASSTPDGDNENETDFIEIEEYVRLGIQLIYQELQTPQPPTKTIH